MLAKAKGFFLLTSVNAQAKHDYQLPIILALVGLITGAITMDIDRAGLAVGAIFGIAMAVAMVITGASRRMRILLRFPVVSTVAFLFAWLLTIAAQIVTPGADGWSMDHNSVPAPIPLFFGGMLGACLVLGEALHMIHPDVGEFASLRRAFRWSPLGGALAVIGGKVGPLSGTSMPFALTIIWQAGIGGMIGCFAIRRRSASHDEPIQGE